MNINFNFYPQNKNSVHNTINFLHTIKKNNEEIYINNNFIQNVNNEEENYKDIKKLVDYFGSNNPLNAPIYIPQKFRSLKFKQKSNKISDNEIYDNNIDINNKCEDNNESDKKEEKYKKPFEIREGD